MNSNSGTVKLSSDLFVSPKSGLTLFWSFFVVQDLKRKWTFNWLSMNFVCGRVAIRDPSCFDPVTERQIKAFLRFVENAVLDPNLGATYLKVKFCEIFEASNFLPADGLILSLHDFALYFEFDYLNTVYLTYSQLGLDDFVKTSLSEKTPGKRIGFFILLFFYLQLK